MKMTINELLKLKQLAAQTEEVKFEFYIDQNGELCMVQDEEYNAAKQLKDEIPDTKGL